MTEALCEIFAWLRGDKPTTREQFLEEQRVAGLAAEMEEAEHRSDAKAKPRWVGNARQSHPRPRTMCNNASTSATTAS
jgi:hypothetical protein